MATDSDQESQLSESLPGTPIQTQVKGKSSIPYAWVILFNKDVDKALPFSIVRLTIFQNSNFPWECITSDMSQQFRLSVRTFSNFPPEDRYYIFAKVEQGMFICYYISFAFFKCRQISVSFSRPIFCFGIFRKY